MFHDTMNHVKETMVLICFKHIQMTIYAYHTSAVIKINNLKNFHLFNTISLHQFICIFEGFNFFIILFHISTFYYTYLSKPKKGLELIEKLSLLFKILGFRFNLNLSKIQIL